MAPSSHRGFLQRAALETNAKPINKAAAEALTDPGYHKIMIENAREFERLSAPLWREHFAELPEAAHSD